MSAIDVALWDIKGKFYSTPVWRLLGAAQKSVPAYITFGLRAYSMDALAEAAKHWVAKGQTRLKIQVGRLNIRGEMDPSGAGAEQREDNPSQDESRVKAVREAVGENVELMVDANCLMKYDAALRWSKRFEPYNLMWFEEPIVHNDRRLLAELRKQTSIPIAAGQWDSFFALSDLVKERAVDFLNIHGLEADLVAVRSAPVQVTALVSNEAQFVRGSVSSMLTAAAQGAKLKILLSLFAERASYDFLVSPSITRPADLKGKKIGVQDFSGLLWTLTMLSLREMGLDPQRDQINIQAIGDSTVIAQSLTTGIIDAAALDKLQSVRLQGLGVKVLLDLSRITFPSSPFMRFFATRIRTASSTQKELMPR